MRIKITRWSQLERLFASGKKFNVTAVMGNVQNVHGLTLEPQGTTNPGTKFLPYIYFRQYSRIDSFKKHMTDYYSLNYVIVPEDAGKGPEIRPKKDGGGDHVLIGALEPDTDQYSVEIGPDFEKEESHTPQAAPQKPARTDWCIIL